MRGIAESNNRSLIYDLLDIAILPAFLMMFTKAVAIAGLNIILELNWDVRYASGLFLPINLTYERTEDVVMVTSYSNLFMFVSIIVGCLVVTSKSLLFNHKKASPYFVLKLAKLDLLHLLKSSFEVYKEAFVWGCFLVTTTIYIFISFLTGQTYGWIAALAVFFCLTFLWIMIKNIEEEMLFHNYR